MTMTLGIDVACRADHLATLSRDGAIAWRGRRFQTSSQDLESLWQDLDLTDPAELTVVMEPTRNAWIVLAQWFRRRGARVVMVPTTQSADLRKYYSKHAKTDKLDSEILAKLPLLHPEGLREFTGPGSSDPLRRLTKQRSSIVKRRTAVLLRIDALLELLGPAWYVALHERYGTAALAFLARYADPNTVLRLGKSRLARFLRGRSKGLIGEAMAQDLIDSARQTLELWGPDGMDFAELASDIATEAEQAIFLTTQVNELDERIANLYADADPDGIVASAPGVGPVIAAVIAGRLGDVHRFDDLAAIRAYSGLVPKVNQSGTGLTTIGITKGGDPLLREMLFIAADQARRIDPQLGAKYARLMSGDRHRNSAMCHLAAALLTRIATCMRTGQPYVLRDTDGREITVPEGRGIVSREHKVDPMRRNASAHKRMERRRKVGAGQVSQESPSAPTSRPALTSIRTVARA